MKILIISLICFLSGGLLYSQTDVKIPVFNIYPDFPETTKQLDSVVQYSYPSFMDSSLMKKWDYQLDEMGVHQSRRYTWRDSLRYWKVTDLYEWASNQSGKPLLRAHYDWPMSNGQWGGCKSEGCGMKEWAYDENGNQVLWAQSYYSQTRKWEVHEKHENLYDRNSNMVLKSVMQRAIGSDYWQGYKEEYSYDKKDHMTGKVRYEWADFEPGDFYRERKDWAPMYKRECRYDDYGQLSSESYYTWDYLNSEWSSLSGKNRFEYQYDSAGRKMSFIVYECDSVILAEGYIYDDYGQALVGFEVEATYDNLMGGWMVIDGNPVIPLEINGPNKNEYKYDDGLLVTETRYSWRSRSGTWEKAKTMWYKYDLAGNLIEEECIREFKTSTERQLRTREQWSHNTSGLITLNTYEYWSEENHEWIPDWKEEKSYDENDRLILDAYYTWDEDENEWKGREERYWDGFDYVTPPGKFEYGYDEAGNLTLYASYAWSDRTKDWRGFEMLRGKKEWEFDSNGRLVSETGYDWDNDTDDWIARQKNIFTLDEEGDPLVQYQYAWNPDMNAWEQILGFFYYYLTATGIDDTESNIEIFPNPTSGLINIRGLSGPAEVKIYSMQGQLLKSVNHDAESIDISELPAGMYIMELVMGQQIINKVFLKR